MNAARPMSLLLIVANWVLRLLSHGMDPDDRLDFLDEHNALFEDLIGSGRSQAVLLGWLTRSAGMLVVSRLTGTAVSALPTGFAVGVAAVGSAVILVDPRGVAAYGSLPVPLLFSASLAAMSVVLIARPRSLPLRLVAGGTVPMSLFAATKAVVIGLDSQVISAVLRVGFTTLSVGALLLGISVVRLERAQVRGVEGSDGPGPETERRRLDIALYSTSAGAGAIALGEYLWAFANIQSHATLAIGALLSATGAIFAAATCVNLAEVVMGATVLAPAQLGDIPDLEAGPDVILGAIGRPRPMVFDVGIDAFEDARVVCRDCVENPDLRGYVSASGAVEDCSFCGRRTTGVRLGVLLDRVDQDLRTRFDIVIWPTHDTDSEPAAFLDTDAVLRTIGEPFGNPDLRRAFCAAFAWVLVWRDLRANAEPSAIS